MRTIEVFEQKKKVRNNAPEAAENYTFSTVMCIYLNNIKQYALQTLFSIHFISQSTVK